MPELTRPSLRRLSLFSVSWYTGVLIGWPLLIAAILHVTVLDTRSAIEGGGALAMTAVSLLILELRPLVQGRGHDPQGVVMSTAFVCAILFLWGLWPAVLCVSIAAGASDLQARKAWWKVLFNIGQYNASVGAGYLVMLAAGKAPSLAHQLKPVHGSDLAWMFGAWVAYFVVNDVIVSAVTAWMDSFRAMITDDVVHYTITTFSVLALSPVIVVVVQNVWALVPLTLVPLLLVYKTAQISLEKEHQAGHDSLTGLPNRKTLHHSLNEALSRSTRDGRTFGLLLIDLDHFKEINDALGHHVGDQMLIRFADRLTASVRTADHVARLGGDEFAVIVPDSDEAQVRAVANRIRQSLLDPVVLDGMLFDLEASIGIAMFPEHARGADDLLRLADVAMYVAKEARLGAVVYSVDRDRNSADRLSLLGALRQALDDQSLELHYQPKVSIADSSLMGMEALIRWPHPTRGFIPPDEFIPMAERSGLMHLITERVVTLALSQMAAWRRQGLHVPVAVNVSVTDLVGARLPELVAAGLAEHHLPAGLLQLEITERIVAQDSDELSPVLLDLDEMGVTLSLDDFGTGYSSLLRLQSLPVSELKIDRSFVSRLTREDSATGIVRAVIDLAHALGMPAIAEGIETEAEWQLLRTLNCDGGQGWHIARPMPADQATRWIRERAAACATADESVAVTGLR